MGALRHRGRAGRRAAHPGLRRRWTCTARTSCSSSVTPTPRRWSRWPPAVPASASSTSRPGCGRSTSGRWRRATAGWSRRLRHPAPRPDRDGRRASSATRGCRRARIRVVGNPVIDAIVAAGCDRTYRRRATRCAASPPTGRPTSTTPLGCAELVALVRRLAAEPRAGDCSRCTRAPRAGSRRAGLLGRAGGAARASRWSSRCPTRDMLATLAAARVAVTDSGGLQEEASWFGVPVVVMRAHRPPAGKGSSGAAVADRARRRRGVRTEAVARLRPRPPARPGSTRCPARTATGTPAQGVVDAAGRPGPARPARPRAEPGLRWRTDLPSLSSAAGHDPPSAGVVPSTSTTRCTRRPSLAGAWARGRPTGPASSGCAGDALLPALRRGRWPRAATGAGSSTARWWRSAYLRSGCGRRAAAGRGLHRPTRRPASPPTPGSWPRWTAAPPRSRSVCVTDGTPRGPARPSSPRSASTDAFDAVVISDELGGRALRKPHPAPFRARAGAAGAAGRATVVHIGDRPARTSPAHAGSACAAIRVLTGEYAERSPSPDDLRHRGASAGGRLRCRGRVEPLLPLVTREQVEHPARL